MERDEIMSLLVVELKAKLAELGLRTNGRKQTLQDRLLEHFGLEQEIDDEEAGQEENVENAINDVANAINNDENSVINDAASSVVTLTDVDFVERSAFTLRDIEESLTSFNGVTQPAIEEWIADFEGHATSVSWNAVQRFIYAKQLLKGAAKAFIRSQREVCSWSALREVLRKEFGTTLSAIEVHRLLKNRRKRPNEDYREYLYNLMEIGSIIKLDDASLIEYFIEGIPDAKANKSNLYQARTIDELKNQIRVYEKIKPVGQQAKANVASTNMVDNKTGVQRYCYKCGNRAHLAKECSSKTFKCFRCGGEGHRAAECKREVNVKVEKNEINILTDDVTQQLSLNKSCVIFKELTKNDYTFSALLDTGCDLCLLRYDTMLMMGDFELSEEKKHLVGVGRGALHTIGSLKTNIVVDGIDLEITFHVVRERDMRYSAIIGNNVLKLVDLIISEYDVRFVNKQPKPLVQKENENAQNVKLDDVAAVVLNKVAKDQESKSKLELLNEFGKLCIMAAEEFKQPVVDLSHLDCGVMVVVTKLIDNYKPKQIKESPISMKILLTDERPVFCRPRRLPEAHKKIVDEQIAEWLQQGIIQPSTSEYASPVVLVAKKDGSKRLCCDYRRLNEKIVRDNFPMPLLDEVIEKLQGASVFTTLDLANGFFHVPIEPGSRKFTAFVTSDGEYEFLFVPFGLCNSPAVFSRFICAIFRDLIHEGVLIAYMDDLVIPAKDINEGVQKLEIVLRRAAEYGLHFRWKKCQILKRKIEFLGYIVEANTIRPTELKTQAVQKFPVPHDRKALQRYLGLTSYFRRFIEGYAMIAKPLSDLLRRDVEYKLNESELAAFEQLKVALMSAPLLRLYDPKALTEVHTDASMHG